jgi:hypothetical protein
VRRVSSRVKVARTDVDDRIKEIYKSGAVGGRERLINPALAGVGKPSTIDMSTVPAKQEAEAMARMFKVLTSVEELLLLCRAAAHVDGGAELLPPATVLFADIHAGVVAAIALLHVRAVELRTVSLGRSNEARDALRAQFEARVAGRDTELQFRERERAVRALRQAAKADEAFKGGGSTSSKKKSKASKPKSGGASSGGTTVGGANNTQRRHGTGGSAASAGTTGAHGPAACRSLGARIARPWRNDSAARRSRLRSTSPRRLV